MTEKVSLFAEERQAQILKMLRKEKKLLVPTLCERFDVSPATIRNDLNDLESRGLLKRTHGGAILGSKTGFEQVSNQKMVKNSEEKEAIAKVAAELVEDGDTIAIDTGTTTLAFARCLAGKKNLTVVTIDLKIALLLEEITDATVIITGGVIRKNYHCAIGPMAVDNMQNLRVDKCFMATNGLTTESGLSTPDLNQAEVKRRMIEIGSQVIVLCDSSKLGNAGFVTVLPTEDIHVLVTDNHADPVDIEKLEQMGVEVKIAEIHPERMTDNE